MPSYAFTTEKWGLNSEIFISRQFGGPELEGV
jgi:hypothetical protein